MKLSLLTDASLLIASINLINTVANIYWSLKLKAISANKEILIDLKEQNEAKDEIIKSLKDERRVLRHQFNTSNSIRTKLEGQLQTYQTIHNNSTIAS